MTKPDGADNLLFREASLRFREAMSRIAAATHLVTTNGAGGKAGLTATAVAPVSDAPASLLVCLNRESRTAAMIRENGIFAVNTLAAGHQELANVFAGRTHLHGLRRFDHGKWEAGARGLPVLSDALVSFSLAVASFTRVGTHDVVIGEVLEIRSAPSHAGLVYARRAFHAV